MIPIYKAYNIAISGEPGPVFIELPMNLQIDKASISDLPTYVAPEQQPLSAQTIKLIEQAAKMLMSAKNPAIFTGWGWRTC